jgi:chromosome segregation ATPase
MQESTMIKFTDEEVSKIQGLQQKVMTTNTRIGEIELLIHGLEREFQELKNEKQSLIGEYANIQQEEVELSVELKEKYGEGTYDISTNQFTPTK